MAYTSEYRWIPNREYNETIQRQNRVLREKDEIDRKYADLKNERRSAEYEMASQRGISQKELDFKLARERERLFAGIEYVSEDLQMAIGRQNVQFREQIERVRLDLGRTNVRVSHVNQRVSSMVADFQRNITAIAEKELAEKERAIYYRNQAHAMYESVLELNPEKLTPGEAKEISDRLAYANTDIDNKDYQAAIGTAQLQVPAASELHARLVVLNEEYRQLMQEIDSTIKETQDRFEMLGKPEKNAGSVNVSGDIVDFDGDIPFWTDGVLNELLEYFYDLVSRIREEYSISMNLDELRSALEDLKQMNARLDRCVELAHGEFYEHCRLQSLVIRIHQSLTANGTWSVIEEETHYTDNDERRSYVLTLDNNSGLIASMILIPLRPIMKDPKTQRPITDRQGNVKHEETQFFLSVSCKDESTEPELCEAVRDGILAGLTDADIDIGTSNRNSRNQNCSDGFVNSSIAIGNKEKDERISIARTEIGL